MGGIAPLDWSPNWGATDRHLSHPPGEVLATNISNVSLQLLSFSPVVLAWCRSMNMPWDLRSWERSVCSRLTLESFLKGWILLLWELSAYQVSLGWCPSLEGGFLQSERQSRLSQICLWICALWVYLISMKHCVVKVYLLHSSAAFRSASPWHETRVLLLNARFFFQEIFLFSIIHSKVQVIHIQNYIVYWNFIMDSFCVCEP